VLDSGDQGERLFRHSRKGVNSLQMEQYLFDVFRMIDALM